MTLDSDDVITKRAIFDKKNKSSSQKSHWISKKDATKQVLILMIPKMPLFMTWLFLFVV